MAEQQQVGIPTREKPHHSKLIPWMLVASIVLGFWAGTQVFASIFQYHEALGAPLFWRLYAPWDFVMWAIRHGNDYPLQVRQSAGVLIFVIGAGFVATIITKIMLQNTAQANKSLHGSARWANKKDIENMALLSNDPKDIGNSVYVGAWEDKKGKIHYLRHSGPEHVLTFAPTRSGKGVGLVIPTLLSWVHSTVVTDLKGELWALTAGWRQKYANNAVLKFEPASKTSVCWNPLDEIRVGTENEVGDVQNLATLIVDPDGKGLEDHWAKTAFALLTGVILFAIYKSKDENNPSIRTLPYVDYILSDPSRPIKQLWEEMSNYNHAAISTAGRDMLDRPDEEGGSVLSTAKSFLSLYRDPIVARNVSCSQFKIKDLMNQDKAASLFIVTQPNDKARLRPLIRILVNMTIRLLADKMDFEGGRPVAHYKHRLLMMMDEFPSLGKLEIMQESLAFVAGYGIKCYLITQDLNQLKSKETGYGQDETITSNCHVQNAYPPNRVETAEHLSKLTGQTTIVKESITTSGRRASAILGQVSKTIQETQRPLLTADECLRMTGPRKNTRGEIEKGGDMLVFVAGYPAIYGTQILYFKDKVFSARSAIKAPEQSDFFHDVQPPEKVLPDNKSN